MTKPEREFQKLKENIQRYFDDFSEMLNCIGNGKRLQILIFLLEEPKNLAEIGFETELGKTALAHHVNLLLKSNLIERIRRGEYEITTDGFKILQNSFDAYITSRKRASMHSKFLSERYFFVYEIDHKEKKQEKILQSNPIYKKHALTYVGAITGVLNSLGVDVTTDEIAGHTGYGFLLCVPKNGLWVSAPTCHLGLETFNRQISEFGWDVKMYKEDKTLSAHIEENGVLSKNDELRAKILFDLVKKEIDKEMPVVLWGIPVPEFGIVKGYSDQNYVISAFRTSESANENLLPYNKLDAVGSTIALTFSSSSENKKSNIDYKKAIRRAISIGESKRFANNNHLSGIEAYKQWITTLEMGREEKSSYFGNAYMITSFLDGRKSATNYLKMITQKFSNKTQANNLNKAVKEYEKVVEGYVALKVIFPLIFRGVLEEDSCQKGSKILTDIMLHERKGLDYLHLAVNQWE